jgi:phosphonopyruvate decarboxylase
MISPQYFLDILKKNGIDFFTGIPDSLLKDVCAYMSDNLPVENNIIAANEGASVGLAAGYYLATNKIPVVYMQNSGIGNAINPLLSLVDKEVYNIPLLLLIGWRGEPGIKDEPQHIKQGKVTLPLLEVMGLKNTILSKDKLKFEEQLKNALSYIRQTKEPYAFVIQKNTFESYNSIRKNANNNSLMAREIAIQIIVESLTPLDIVVSTTGMISRELFEYRKFLNQGHKNDFLT